MNQSQILAKIFSLSRDIQAGKRTFYNARIIEMLVDILHGNIQYATLVAWLDSSDRGEYIALGESSQYLVVIRPEPEPVTTVTYSIYHPIDGVMNHSCEVGEIKYTYVASVEARNLNEAFRLSQNDFNAEYASYGLRSTSVGDVIEEIIPDTKWEDNFFMVMGNGYKTVDPNSLLDFNQEPEEDDETTETEIPVEAECGYWQSQEDIDEEDNGQSEHEYQERLENMWHEQEMRAKDNTSEEIREHEAIKTGIRASIIEAPMFTVEGIEVNEYTLRNIMLQVAKRKLPAGFQVTDCKGKTVTMGEKGYMSDNLSGMDVIDNIAIEIFRLKL